MPVKKMPGSYFDIGMMEWFNTIIDTYEDIWGHRPHLLDAGMENIASPSLVFRINGRQYFLLERRNDDGEWAPLLFDAGDVASDDTSDVFAYMSRITEYAQELTGELHERGIIIDHQDEQFSQCLAAVLYGYRDLVSPDALD
jgi:hypothetical protein